MATTPDSPSNTLIILDGSLASLVAAWRAAASITPGQHTSPDGASPLILFVPAADAPRLADRAPAIATLCSAQLVIDSPTDAYRIPSGGPARADTTLLLLRATLIAMARSAGRIIWPLQTAGIEGLAAATRAFDRTLLIEQLLLMDSPSGVPTIETPLLDFSDDAIADLAADLGVPFELAAFCRQSPAPACGSCPSCRRWIAAAQKVGASV